MKAFPRADGRHDSSKADEQGMDLRDYFAAKAMNGLLSDSNCNSGSAIALAKMAYMMANAMMEARK